MMTHPQHHIRKNQALAALANSATNRAKDGISLAPATIKLLLTALTLAVCGRDIDTIEILLDNVVSLPLTTGIVHDIHALVGYTELMWSLVWVDQPVLAQFVNLDTSCNLHPDDYPLGYN